MNNLGCSKIKEAVVMAIKIIKEPDIHITSGDLARYREEYDRAMMYYAGPRPTLEEWIRGQLIPPEPSCFHDGETWRSR